MVSPNRRRGLGGGVWLEGMTGPDLYNLKRAKQIDAGTSHGLSISWPRAYSLALSHQTISVHGMLSLAATGSLSNLGSQGKEASFLGMLARARGDGAY